MKKIFAMLLIMALALTCAFAETSVIEPIAGVICDITDEDILINRGDMGFVIAHRTEDTLITGADSLDNGMYVFRRYSGIMTRSLPPQITADEICVYTLKGICTNVEENSFTINDSEMGDVIVTLENASTSVAVGSPVTVYHSGVMTLSLPSKVNALKIDTFTLEGYVYSLDSDGFLLTSDDGVLYKILSENAVSVGENVKVLYDGKLTRSIPAQAYALGVVYK